MTVNLRRAEQSDLAAIRLITRAAYEHYIPRIGREPAPVAADYSAAIHDGHAWVATEYEEVVGLVVLVPQPGHLLLRNLAVVPSAQGKGIGSRLLALSEDEARRRGLREIRLYTNEAMTENLAYYPRRGYVETHRAVQDGFNRVFFRKLI